MNENKDMKNKLTTASKVCYVLKGSICGAGLTALATTGPTLMMYGGCGHIGIYPYLALGIGILSGLGAIGGAGIAIENVKDYEKTNDGKEIENSKEQFIDNYFNELIENDEYGNTESISINRKK